MSFLGYDAEAIRLLSAALAEVMAQTDQRLPAAELAAFDRAVTRKLIEAYDSGERDLDALKRAGATRLQIATRWKGLQTPGPDADSLGA